MKRILLQILIFLFATSIVGQVQVSEIMQVDSSAITGSAFANYEGKSYVISPRTDETLVTELNQGELGNITKITSRPFSGNLKAILIEDERIVHSYSAGSIISHGPSGITTDTIIFNDYTFSRYATFIREGRYLCQILKSDEWQDYLQVYDTASKESSVINVENYSLQFGTRHILLKDAEENIYEYDFELKTLTVINQLSSSAVFVTRTDKEFIYADQSTIHIYNEDLDYRTVSCLDTMPLLEDISIYEDKLIMSIKATTQSSGTTIVLDLESCEQLQQYDRHYDIQESPLLPEGFLLLQSYGEWSGPGTFKMLDIKTGSIYDFDIWTDVLFLEGAVFADNKLFILGFDDLHYSSSRQCYVFDFNTLTGDVFEVGNDLRAHIVDIDLSVVDSTINFISITQNEPFSIWQLDLILDQQAKINIASIYPIAGLGQRSGDATALSDDSFLSSYSQKLYLTTKDNTSEVLDGTYSIKSLNLNGSIHLLVERNDSLFAAVYEDQAVTYHYLATDYYQGAFFRYKTSNAIFLPENLHYNGSSKSLDSIPFATNEFIETVIKTSGDVVLAYQWKNSNRDYYTYNTVTKTLTYLEFLDGMYFEAYSIGDSRFLIVEDGSGTVNTGKVFILDAEGKQTLQESIEYTNPYYGGYTNAASNFTTVAVPGDDVTIFYLSDDLQTKVKQVVNEGTLYYRYFQVGYYEDEIVLDVIKDDTRKFAHLSWEGEPTYFGEMDNQEEIQGIFINYQVITCVLYDRYQGNIRYVQYDKESKEELLDIEMEKGNEKLQFSSVIHRMSDDEVLMSLDDGVHGIELYKLNINTLQYELVSDIFTGPLSSQPEFVIATDDYVFFSAYTTGNKKQLFRFDSSGDTSTTTSISNDRQLIVHPNPTADFLTPDQILTEYTIYDIQGKVIDRRASYSGKRIDISWLSAGAYMIIGKTESNETVNSKFIKI